MNVNLGKRVLYRMTKADAEIASAHGNNHVEGQLVPAVIVRSWGMTPESAHNLQVLTDGHLTMWRTSVLCGDHTGQFSWPASE